MRRLKPKTNEPTSNENDAKPLDLSLLRGLAKKVTTQGKGILKSMLPGSEKVNINIIINHC